MPRSTVVCTQCGALSPDQCSCWIGIGSGAPVGYKRDAEIERLTNENKLLREKWREALLKAGLFPDMADKVIAEALREEG